VNPAFTFSRRGPFLRSVIARAGAEVYFILKLSTSIIIASLLNFRKNKIFLSKTDVDNEIEFLTMNYPRASSGVLNQRLRIKIMNK
jgi:hypothetical protein